MVFIRIISDIIQNNKVIRAMAIANVEPELDNHIRHFEIEVDMESVYTALRERKCSEGIVVGDIPLRIDSDATSPTSIGIFRDGVYEIGVSMIESEQRAHLTVNIYDPYTGTSAPIPLRDKALLVLKGSGGDTLELKLSRPTMGGVVTNSVFVPLSDLTSKVYNATLKPI